MDLSLPPGLTARPLTPADAPAVVEVMAALQLRELGAYDIEEADLVADWNRPSFDIAEQTVGVFDGDELVAYAEHSGGDRADAAVHPDRHGLGIGTALALWLAAKAEAAGQSWLGMPVPAGGSGDRLLAALGWQVRWTSWVLTLPGDQEVPPRPLPAGYLLRQARPDEYPAVHEMVEDAFLEWSQRPRQPYEDFLARTVGRPGFEPWTIRVVADDSGRVVAMALVVLADIDVLEGFVEQVAVRSDQRRRGLAQALLVDAFTQARAHGAVRSALSTDSRTGALGLYEKVGMRVCQTWVNRAVEL